MELSPDPQQPPNPKPSSKGNSNPYPKHLKPVVNKQAKSPTFINTINKNLKTLLSLITSKVKYQE
jgi:hypothetical protein